MRRGKDKRSDEYPSESSDQENNRNGPKKKTNGDTKAKTVTARIIKIEKSSMVISDEDREHLLTPSSDEPVTVVAAEVRKDVDMFSVFIRWFASFFTMMRNNTCSEISSGRVV